MIVVTASAQETEKESELEGRHQIELVLSHAHVPHSIYEGETKWQSMASFGINYNYWLTSKWGVGLHTDIVLDSFVVDPNLDGADEEPELEREYPIAPALMGVYKPGEHLMFMLGAGAEFAPEETLMLFRAEVGYGWEIGEGLELGLSLGYDFRVDAYDSWLMGLGVAKNF